MVEDRHVIEALGKVRVVIENGEITEDGLKYFEDEIQKLTDEYVKEIDEKIKTKEKEITTI